MLAKQVRLVRVPRVINQDSDFDSVNQPAIPMTDSRADICYAVDVDVKSERSGLPR